MLRTVGDVYGMRAAISEAERSLLPVNAVVVTIDPIATTTTEMRVTETHLLLAYIMVNYFVSSHNIYLTERERERRER